MRFISLINCQNQNVITINADHLLLRIEIDGIAKEIRIKPFMASILYRLFQSHPHPLAYDQIVEDLKQHHLIVTDVTRMHRKLSEIRTFIEKWHPSLKDIILNTRGVGYALPLQFKNLHQREDDSEKIKFVNSKIQYAVEMLGLLMKDSIKSITQTEVVQNIYGYVIDREPLNKKIIKNLHMFSECEKTILKEIKTHEADFNFIRISYLLAKMKTYIGLARISEYPISTTQWKDWFQQEVNMIFNDLIKKIQWAEKPSVI